MWTLKHTHTQTYNWDDSFSLAIHPSRKIGIYKKIILILLFVHYILKADFNGFAIASPSKKLHIFLSFKEYEQKQRKNNNKEEKRIKCAREIIKTSHKLPKTIMFQAKWQVVQNALRAKAASTQSIW